MIEVVPFIQTAGSEKFKEFLAKPFLIDMLYPVFGDKSIGTLFDGWKGEDILDGYKFTNKENYILEFYSDYLIIRKENNKLSYLLPLSKSIGDFINKMYMFGIQLYWTKWIDENFEPKDYMNKNEIQKYFNDLLNKIGKSNEL